MARDKDMMTTRFNSAEMGRSQNSLKLKFVFFEKVNAKYKGKVTVFLYKKDRTLSIQNRDYQVKTYQESREYHV